MNNQENQGNRENQEKRESKRLPGFYIALCCCVIAVGIAGYFTERATDGTEDAPTDDVQTVAGVTQPDNGAGAEGGLSIGADVTTGVIADLPAEQDAAADADVVTDNSAVSVDAPADNVTDDRSANIEMNTTPESESAEAADAPQVIYEDMSRDDEAAEAAALFTSPTFVLPASGEILEGFTESLVYNTALGDWRTHNGVDIAVDTGGSVCAAADGTVSKISSDAMGEYVVIDHDGGFSSKYCGLSSIENIAEGDSVTEGEVIGIVADAKAENVAESHVHFELYKDGEPVDPMKYTG